jgi:hypothetical protein
MTAPSRHRGNVVRSASVALASAGCVFLFTPLAAARPAGTPLSVVTALTPESVKFGDPVTAELTVRFDSSSVSPASIRVDPGLTPYVAMSRPTTRVSASGVAQMRYSLTCLTSACLPVHGSRLVHLEPVVVTARAGSQTLRAVGHWPAVTVTSRLSPSALTGRARFRHPAGPPAPAYRISPSRLIATLVGAAALCVLAAALIAGRVFVGVRRRPVAISRSALDLAIAYVRDSIRRDDADRRRALALLSETVDTVDPDLASTSAASAWSKPPPTAGAASALADRASSRAERLQ